MPYYRRSYVRRPRRRYPSRYRAVKAIVNRAIDRHMENKIVSQRLNVNFGTITTAWVESTLAQVQQGTAENQRLGRKIRIKSVFMKGVIAGGTNEVATDDPYNYVRLILGIYNGSGLTPLATAGALRDDPITTVLGCRSTLRKKLFDKYVTFQVTSTEKGGGDGYTPQLKQIKYYHRFKNGLLINFGDDNVTYFDKMLFLSCISDSAAAPSPGFIGGYIGLTFEDA